MDLSFSPEDLAFQETVRDWLRTNLPAEIKHKMHVGLELTKEERIDWQNRLSAKGWMAPGWPVKYGGQDWSVTQRHIFEEEFARNDAPSMLPFGVAMIAPVIIEFGSEEQRAHYLPRILSSEDWWCQGYSEPGSGSDLASLQLKAERQGDEYLLNGQKTWITLAQFANWIFVLARTDPSAKKQNGISFILVDMATPGVTVRPIETIDGGHEINEVSFENVRVPAKNLVGKENEAWTYAKFLLEHERNGTAGVAGSFHMIERLKQMAKSERVNGSALLDDIEFQQKIASTEIELLALSFAQMRSLAAESSGKSPGAESSFIKIKGTEIQQRITELMKDAVGYGALDPDTHSAAWYFNFRKTSIYAGSNEIQRNIIAKRILGL